MDGLSIARFPKANRVWLLLYLRSKNKRAISTCRTVGVEALIWTRKREYFDEILMFFFNCVLWELSLLSGCVRWSTILLRASLDENGLDYAAQGVLSALMGLMMTPHFWPELVRDFSSCWSKEEVLLISQHLLQNTSDVCLTTSLQNLDSKACTWLKSLFGFGWAIVRPWNKSATVLSLNVIYCNMYISNWRMPPWKNHQW